MARRKISEYRAKQLIAEPFGTAYAGISVDLGTDWRKAASQLPENEHYVVKVDQGVKGRFKKGLVKLNRTAHEVEEDLQGFAKEGYDFALVEPYAEHEQADERYLAFEVQRGGDLVSCSHKGGVDIENHASSLQHEIYSLEVSRELDSEIGLPQGTIEKLHDVFKRNYVSFLEINPLVVTDGVVQILDAAAEVDEEAATLVDARWSPHDFRRSKARTPEENAVEDLAGESQASFRLEVLNPNGQIFLLLSGGGASVVLADEVHNQGFGSELGNYGEYSGNPNEDETYSYTKQIVSLMLKSSANRKVLIIGGGVANFTDVRVTFRGVIRALEEVKDKIREQNIQVFVRRGGPYEAEGLAQMADFLKREGLMGLVAGPDLMLAEIVPTALATLGSAK